MPSFLVWLLIGCIRPGDASPPPPTPEISMAAAEDLARNAAAIVLKIAPASVRLSPLGNDLPFPAFLAKNPGLGSGPRKEQQGIGVLVVDGQALIGTDSFVAFLQSSWVKNPDALAAAWLYLFKSDPGTIRGKKNQDSDIADPVFRKDDLVFTYTSAFNRNPSFRVTLSIVDGAPVAQEAPL